MKKGISKQNKILAATALMFSGAYFIMNINDKPIVAFINGIFIIGLLYIIIGMGTYIRNVGLFKTYKYFVYKLKSGAYRNDRIGQIKTMSLAEFTEELLNPKNKAYGKPFYIWGFGLTALSYVMVLITNC